MTTGRMIVFEGIDGAGTSTQAARLHRWLAETQAAAHLCREPSDRPIGRLLRRMLTGETAASARSLSLLFAADRLDHFEADVLPRLRAGTHVVSDRSLYSTLAYQGASLPLEWIAQLNGFIPEPDVVIYLRVPVEVALGRRTQRGGQAELFDDLSVQAAVAAVYDDLFGAVADDGCFVFEAAEGRWRQSNSTTRRRLPAQIRIGRQPRVAVIDGSATMDEIAFRVRQLFSLIASAHQGHLPEEETFDVV